MAKQNNLKPESLKSEEETNTNTKPKDDLSFETKPYTENSVIGGNETAHGVAAHGSANQKALMIHQLHTTQQAHANQQLVGGSKHTIPVHLTPYHHLTPSISNTGTMKNQISATKNHANVVNNQRSTCGANGAVCDDLLSNESQTGGSKKTKKNYKNSKNNKNSKKTMKNKKSKKNEKTKKNKKSKKNEKTMKNTKNTKIKGILKKTKNNKKMKNMKNMKKTNKSNKNKKVRFN